MRVITRWQLDLFKAESLAAFLPFWLLQFKKQYLQTSELLN